MAHQIGPAMVAGQQRVERLGLDRGVADDAEQLLVAPHVVLVRGDVEIAADQLALAEVGLAEPGLQLLEEIELVAEFRVHLGVGSSPPAGM